MTNVIRRISHCRVCKCLQLSKVLSFGPTPLANAFLDSKQAEDREYYYPLDVYFCKNCSFLQLGHVVSPRELFRDYIYVSSTSSTFVDHFKDFADSISHKLDLGKDSFVIDVGSNDGILLKPLKRLGIKVLGIEPVNKIARLARRDGINTVADFISVKLAKKISKKYGKAHVITAANVFAHIDNLDDVIQSFHALLAADGVIILEAPYLIDFIEKRYFDLVYHEHLSYWSVKTLIRLFQRFNMRIFDVEKVESHGGSIRVFVTRNESNYQRKKAVDVFLDKERKASLSSSSTFTNYARTIQANKISLLNMLTSLKSEGKIIAGYGAPAKGNTLLNYFGIGPEILDFIIDDNTWKQGLFTPGKRIPVVASKYLQDHHVDYMVILAWNFAESIIYKNEKFSKNGGRFIIPAPLPKII